jgi:hypothetical protein
VGTPLSPVLFGLVCASTLQALPEGASYVDDCSLAIPFSSPRQLQLDSSRLLDAVKEQFESHWTDYGGSRSPDRVGIDINNCNCICDGNGREPSWSWREVKEIIDGRRLMIEPRTPTSMGRQSHRSSMIDLVISSNSAQVSMIEIATDLYTGSDHETLVGEINDEGNEKWETHTVATPRKMIRKLVKNDEKNEEQEWRQQWMNRICPDGKPSLLSPWTKY